ncbi:MAG: hypothetical protein DRG30_10015 [Epsilonproteobacteria bacterium]|nr:MAG: hypothetical protein DRG30_10015 [Campylobacterota bacterium]
MIWQKHADGYQLLAKHNLKTGKREYIGRRSKETEKISSSFKHSKFEIKERHPSYPIKDSLQCCRCDHVAQMMICSCDTLTPTKSNKFKV